MKHGRCKKYFGLASAHLILTDGQQINEHFTELEKSIPELRETLRLKSDYAAANATLATTTATNANSMAPLRSVAVT